MSVKIKVALVFKNDVIIKSSNLSEFIIFSSYLQRSFRQQRVIFICLPSNVQ